MSKSGKDGGFAFPGVIGNPKEQSSGMTLRDWYAGRAIPVVCDALDKGYFEADDYADAIAEFCYEIADAMLKARGK